MYILVRHTHQLMESIYFKIKKVEGYIKKKKKIECDSKCLMLTATVTDTFRQKVPTNEVSNGPHVPDHSGMERRQADREAGRQTVELITNKGNDTK